MKPATAFLVFAEPLVSSRASAIAPATATVPCGVCPFASCSVSNGERNGPAEAVAGMPICRPSASIQPIAASGSFIPVAFMAWMAADFQPTPPLVIGRQDRRGGADDSPDGFAG